jgi:hypothetical protein
MEREQVNREMCPLLQLDSISPMLPYAHFLKGFKDMNQLQVKRRMWKPFWNIQSKVLFVVNMK